MSGAKAPNWRENKNSNWRTNKNETNGSAATGNWRQTGTYKKNLVENSPTKNFKKHFESRQSRHVRDSPKDSTADLLDPTFLDNLSNNGNVNEITSFLVLNITDFSKSLALDLSEDIFVALLKLIAKACENTFISSKTNVLKLTMQSKFVNTICSFFSRLLIAGENTDPLFWRNVEIVVEKVFILLESCLQLIPLTCWEHLNTIANTLTLVLPVLQETGKMILPRSFDSRALSLKNELSSIESRFKKTKGEGGANETDQPPEDDFHFIDVYPKIVDVTLPERPYIRKNIVKGKFPSVRDYLDIHFRLLREDFVNPIRQDVCDYLIHTKRHLFNIKVHRNATFLQWTSINNNSCQTVRFDVSQGLQRAIGSENHKRFLHGMLLFFSHDNFHTMECAKVVNSDHLKEGILTIKVERGVLESHKTYTMIECVLLFEPYYQVLKVFQLLEHKNFPMERYIVKVETNIYPPQYMQNARKFDIPHCLNPSQKIALQAALDKEFVIIQGPPGTGKTFLGMQLIKLLLKYKGRGSGPILIVTYTNHALDQFLNGLRGCTDKIVRLGQKSTDLQEASENYGPERQLLEFIDNRDRRKFRVDQAFLRKVREACGIFMRIGHFPNSLGYMFCDYDFFDLNEIPLELRRWMAIKDSLNKVFKTLKRKEEKLKEKEHSLNILSKERDGIFLEPFLSKCDEDLLPIVPYYFDVEDFLCWLLCDDGTISTTQVATGNIEELAQTNTDETEVLHLLSNVIFGGTIKEFLGISTLEDMAKDLEKAISTNLHIKERKFLNQQVDFLKKKIKYLKFCLNTDLGHQPVPTYNVSDPFMFPSRVRWQLYKDWLRTFKFASEKEFFDLQHSMEMTYDWYNELREADNATLLKSMDIVGMTTTCAARLRSTLEATESPILLVEEAAEVLESHIIAALTKHCKHLILIGDHKQLRPKTCDHVTDKKYRLGISLFERMILNNIECHTLNVQHRMRPEISSLISPLIYKDLTNHRSVEDYPPVSGLQYPLYFIDHKEPEEPYGDSSKKNVHEAKFLIQLAIYLLQNNYKPHDITILAAYRGQMYEMKSEQQKMTYEGIRDVQIAVVDNFQGEENKIVLLSLVRSNPEKESGFLSLDNRVCVALSRAKHGLYIMGNMEQLCGTIDIWKSIKNTLKSQTAISASLPLQCKRHKEHITFVSKNIDFLKVPEGGCSETCSDLLNCGHRCARICHGSDSQHKLYNCMQICNRLLCPNEAHQCKKHCFEKCGPCNYSVQRQLPCGHIKTLACYINYEKYKCREPKKIEPDCGHDQLIPCFVQISEFQCHIEVERELPRCQHMQTMLCCVDLAEYMCQVNVERKMPTCNHYETMLCSEDPLKRTCQVVVEREMPKCGHIQTMVCSGDVEMLKCRIKIEATLKCGHTKEKECGDEQVECRNTCGQTLPCGHKCPLTCHFGTGHERQFKQCQQRCLRNLRDCNNPESHGKCKRLCCEPCDPCKHPTIKHFENCSHYSMVTCSEARISLACRKPCSKKLPCGHFCKKTCGKPCSQCNKYTFKMIPECKHQIKVRCMEIPLHKNCSRPCNKQLSCSHTCQNPCNEPCTTECKKRCRKSLECGHRCIATCSENCVCKGVVIPECGHYVNIKCGDDIRCTRRSCMVLLTQPRENKCNKLLSCGHPCKKVDCNDCDPKCEALCGKPLSCGHGCKEPCGTATCTQRCSETCKKMMKCGHVCLRICSFPCDKLMNCNDCSIDS